MIKNIEFPRYFSAISRSSCCTPNRCIFVQYANCILYLAGI
nr:MAG TPA: conopeptide [Caudoviricetes sp.]